MVQIDPATEWLEWVPRAEGRSSISTFPSVEYCTYILPCYPFKVQEYEAAVRALHSTVLPYDLYGNLFFGSLRLAAARLRKLLARLLAGERLSLPFPPGYSPVTVHTSFGRLFLRC
jgi:hypothetical protein